MNNDSWVLAGVPELMRPPPQRITVSQTQTIQMESQRQYQVFERSVAYMQMAPRPSLVSVPFDRATSLQSPYGQMIPEKPLQPFQPQLEPQYQPQFMQQFQPHFQQQFQHQWQPHFQQHFQQQCQTQFEPPLQRQLQTQVPAWHPDVSANPNVGQMYNPLILNSSVRGQLPPETLRAMSPQWQQQGTNVPPVYHPESSLNQDEKRFNDSKLTVPKPKAILGPIATSNVDLELEESKVENRRGNRDNELESKERQTIPKRNVTKISLRPRHCSEASTSATKNKDSKRDSEAFRKLSTIFTNNKEKQPSKATQRRQTTESKANVPNQPIKLKMKSKTVKRTSKK